MELQPSPLGTSSIVAAFKRALSLIPRPHETPHRSGDSAHSRRRVGIFEALSGTFDFAEALGLEPFEFLRHGRFDHGSEVGTRHERREPLELVVKLGARRELHSVPRRRQRLDDRRLVSRFGSRGWLKFRGWTTLSGEAPG